HVATPRTCATLRAHVLASARLRRELRRPLFLPVNKSVPTRSSRPSRLASALAAHRDAVRTSAPEVVVVLTTDHILQIELRELVRAHRASGADLTLVGVPRPSGEVGAAPILRLDPG